DKPKAHEIKRYSDECINSKWPLKREEDLDYPNLDLMKIWHFDNMAKATSLKALEFFFRLPNIKELPFEHDKIITRESEVKKIINYCIYDLKPTEIFYLKSKDHILHRVGVTKMLGISAMNMPDASIGENITLKTLSDKLDIPFSQIGYMRTQRDIITIKDVIFDYIWRTPYVKKVIEKYFSHIVLKSSLSEKGNKIFDLKSVPDYKVRVPQGTTIQIEGDLEITYGMGGIHGCIKKGVYTSDDEYMIMSCDVAGEYPNVITGNNLYIDHFGPQFVPVYKEHIVDERKKWPKSTHRMLNRSYKDAGNCVFGKTNSEYSGLYDPLILVSITVNGQLMKTLLGEMLSQIPMSTVLMMNTDGLEIKFPRRYKYLYDFLCKRWEKLTNLVLEHDEYDKLVINNVNNYIGFYSSGKVKRKGLFVLREDLEREEQYHKNPSGMIINQAIFDYFQSGTPVEDTINNCTDIYDFCLGYKKQKGFDFGLLIANESRTVKIKKYNDRLLRVYVATHKGEKYTSGSLVKFWHDGRITSILKDYTVQIAQRIIGKDLSRYQDINYNYYIKEAYKIISEIEGMETL
ncbi:hypothetical protein KC622_03025, partial [Candidatus Dojkabacteria bacterium]|nr:hypothetical protein [Candidatus Dojkabacteria bacterium]